MDQSANDIDRSLKGQKILIGIFCLIAIFQSGLRDINNLPEENDTGNYQSIYEQILSESWLDLLDDFTLFGSEYTERDGGYPVFIKLTQMISGDFTFFMFLTAAFFIIPLGILINRYVMSNLGILLSFAIYFALFANIVNCFMRQAIVLGIFLFATRYVISRNWKLFFGLMFIAFTIHNSSLIALPFYFIPIIKDIKKWLLVTLVASPILLYLSGLLVSRILAGTVYAVFLTEDNYGVASVIILIDFVSILALLFYKRLEDIPYIDLLLGGMMVALLLLPFVRIGGTIMRISYYYIISIIPLIPVIIDCVFNNQKNKPLRIIAYFFSICFFTYMFLK